MSEKAKDSVTDTKDKVEKLLDQSVNHSLNRIGLVTVKDIQYLESLILQLHSKVDFLVEENKLLKEQIVKKWNNFTFSSFFNNFFHIYFAEMQIDSIAFCPKALL